MKVGFAASFERSFAKFRREHPDLEQTFWRRVELFREFPHHPSLENHKLSGQLDGFRAFSLTKKYRVVYRLAAPDEAIFTRIGDHDDVY